MLYKKYEKKRIIPYRIMVHKQTEIDYFQVVFWLISVLMTQLSAS